jgi:protease-4
MQQEGSVKRPRAGKAVLLLFFLVAVSVVIALVLSVDSEKEEERSFLAELLGTDQKIGIVTLEGVIESSDKVLKQLRKYRKKSSVRAIILRINSHGGAVAPAQEIYREIGRIKAKKPVVASIETVGASAAYYIASNADRVVCSPGTITGSIGVIMVLAEIHKVIEKIGVNVNVIKAGKFKDIGSGIRPLTSEERDILESFAMEVHEQFIKDVEAGRKGKIDLEKLRAVADGSFFTGEKAKELGLVDELGNFYDAVKIAKDLARIKGEPELLYPKKKWDRYLDIFLDSLAGVIVKAADRSRLIQAVPIVR